MRPPQEPCPAETRLRLAGRPRPGACSAARSYPWMVPAPRIAPPKPDDRDAEERPAAAFLHRAEVRDVLAWMRLLVDPQDAAAVVRALARPPIELRQVHPARVI